MKEYFYLEADVNLFKIIKVFVVKELLKSVRVKYARNNSLNLNKRNENIFFAGENLKQFNFGYNQIQFCKFFKRLTAVDLNSITNLHKSNVHTM